MRSTVESERYTQNIQVAAQAIATTKIMLTHRTLDGHFSFFAELDKEVSALTVIVLTRQRAGDLRDDSARTLAVLSPKSSSTVRKTWTTDPETDLAAHTTGLLDFHEYAINKEKV